MTASTDGLVERITNSVRERFDERSILKELIANADDAGANHFCIDAFSGWAKPDNLLLRGPGLLVANDGRFDEGDQAGIFRFGESGKAADQAAIGKFGMGQKAVFRLCDAFVVVRACSGVVTYKDVVNPCVDEKESDNLPSTWDCISDGDAQRLLERINKEFKGDVLIFWFPFRREEIIPRPYSGFATIRPDIGIINKLAREDDLPGFLTMLCNLKSIEVRYNGNPLSSVRVDECQVPRLCPPFGDDDDRDFHGTIGGQRFVGRKTTRDPEDKLKCLSKSMHWPTTPKGIREKGTPHGAAILLRSGDARQLRISWAVFLPISEALDERPSLGDDVAGIHLLLHGYFFVDSGRSRIEWLDGSEDQRQRTDEYRRLTRDWNTQLRDTVVLPLIPCVLKHALADGVVTAKELPVAVGALVRTRWFRTHRAAICRDRSLVRALEGKQGERNVRWRLVPTGAKVRALPATLACHPQRLDDLFCGVDEWKRKQQITLCIDETAALTASPMRWMPGELDSLFARLSPRAFQVGDLAALLNELLPKRDDYDISRHLVRALRDAMIANVNGLVKPGDLQKLLRYERLRDHLFVLKNTIRSPVLVALAKASVDILPVCGEWLEQSVRAAQQPTLRRAKDLKPLLAALGVLIAGDRDAWDDASDAALKLLAKQDVQPLTRDDDFRDIRVIKVRDPFSQQPTMLSLGELPRNHLFRSPKVEDESKVESDLRTLGSALRESPLIIVAPPKHPIQELTRTSEPSTYVELANAATEFGEEDDRSKVIKMLIRDDDTYDARTKSAIRRLCAGHSGASGPAARLRTVPDNPIERIIKEIMRDDHAEFIVPSSIAHGISEDTREALCIGDFGRQGLNQFCLQHLENINRFCMTRDEREAFFTVELDDDLLKRLRIWERSDGVGSADDECFWVGDTFSMPCRLRNLVPRIILSSNDQIQGIQQEIVREWSPQAQIHTALSQSEPYLYQREILAAIEACGGDIRKKLQSDLRETRWITAGDRHVSPADLLNLPPDVEEAAKALLDRDRYVTLAQLPEEEFRNHPGALYVEKSLVSCGTLSVARLAQEIKRAKLEGWIGDADSYPIDDLIDDFRRLAEEVADLGVKGWPLLRVILLSICDRDVLREIVRSFGEVTNPRTAGSHLDALVEVVVTRGEHMAEAAKRAFEYGFTVVAGEWAAERQAEVFAHTRVPTRAPDIWRKGSEVAPWGGHIVPEDVLDESYGRKFPIATSDDEKPTEEVGTWLAAGNYRQAFDQQRKFIGDWERYLPLPELMAVYLWFAGRHNPEMKCFREKRVCALSRPELGKLDRILRPTDFRGRTVECGRLSGSLRAVFFINEVRGEIVRTRSLSGCGFDARMRDGSALFVDKCMERRSIDGEEVRAVSIRVREVGHFSERSPNERVRAFQDFVKDAARTYFLSGDQLLHARKKIAKSSGRPVPTKIEECPLEEFFKIVDKVADVGGLTQKETECWLRDELAPLLDGLSLRSGSRSARYLRDYRDAQGAESSGDYARHKAKLWKSITCSEEAQREILDAVRRKIRALGYGPHRVLFELFQNADDAYQEQRSSAGRFNVHFYGSAAGGTAQPGFRVEHWGRPINHPGTTDPGAGRERLYHHDLRRMLVMGVSEKHEDSLTGKFGLGFKCVHLLSDSVGIVSGLISVKTVGGIIPTRWNEGLDLAQERQTVIDVPYCTTAQADGEHLKRAFLKALTWLPAFARRITRIDVRLGAQSRSVCCIKRSVDSIDVIKIKDSEWGTQRALRLDLGGAAAGDSYRLLLKIGSDGPECFEPGLSRLWYLVPLEEGADSGPTGSSPSVTASGTGWLLDGPFPVPPGRGGLAWGGAQDPRELFADLGRALGDRLLDLHALIERDWTRLWKELDCSPDSSLFWDGLFTVMSQGIDDKPARWLHDPPDSGETSYRGYGHLVANRKVVPTGLPMPYNNLVQASSVRWFASSALGDKDILEATRRWKSACEINNRIVAPGVRAVLVKLGFNKIQPMTLSELIGREMRSDDHKIGPNLGKRLGMVVTLDRIRSGPLQQEQHVIAATASKANFQAQDESWHSVEDLISEKNINEDERRVCMFAPRDVVLSDKYGCAAVRFFELARSKSGHRPPVGQMLVWARSADDDGRKRAVLQYTICGHYGRQLASRLRKDCPVWIRDVLNQGLSHSLLGKFSDHEKAEVLLALDRERIPREVIRSIGDGTSVGPGPRTDPGKLLRNIYEWWKRECTKERLNYEKSVYPERFRDLGIAGELCRRDPINRVAWFTMFALARYQSFGRTQDEQHRSYIQIGMCSGWWTELAESKVTESVEPWIKRLRQWSAPSRRDESFHQWEATLGDLATFARGLDVYVELIRKFPGFLDAYGRDSLDVILLPHKSRLAQDLGLLAAPIKRTMGIGVNWLIRELLRYEYYGPRHAALLAPYCWTSSERVRNLLSTLGLNADAEVHGFVKDHLGKDAVFLGDYDLPLQIVTRESYTSLRNRWLREAGFGPLGE